MAIQTQGVSLEWGGRTLSIETGLFAGQANGSVTVQYGDTVVLVTATMAREPRPGMEFFPLTVDYEERMYAAGKMPGSRFVRRETRPGEDAILNSRLIDRSIRPQFPKGALNDVQIVVTTLAYDGENEVDIVGLIGASAALHISNIPFEGPIAGVKIGIVDGDFVINPTHEQVENGAMELVVAARKEGICMIEAGAKQVPEEQMIEAHELAFRLIAPVLALQDELREKVGKAKTEMKISKIPDSVTSALQEKYGAQFKAALLTPVKGERNENVEALKSLAKAELSESLGDDAKYLGSAFEKLAEKLTRASILEDGVRPDGRKIGDLRELTAKVSLLPRTHGTGLFSRGETQVLTIATLGSPGDEKIIDGLDDEEKRRYLHHYNFPPYSVGEARPMRGPGRREIGHGALAEKALVPVLPAQKDFPYTLRCVSEVLSSNGSTSMASVCGSTLALMDAGVPILAPVAGISIGLVKEEGDKYTLLTDIAGIEDFYGDMDFKVAGTKEGITAIQLDTKAKYLSMEMIPHIFSQAYDARLKILEVLNGAIQTPRAELSQYAPRILTVNIPVERIGEVIGPGGKMIRSIVERTGAKIDIEDDGTVFISSLKAEGGEMAAKIISDMTREIEIGEEYTGTVTRLMNFGAFVEILPGKEGLIRISDLSWEYVPSVEDVLKVGDEVKVVVNEIDDQNRVNLSRKALMPKPEGYQERAPRGEGGGDRGPRREGGNGGEGGGQREGGENRGPRPEGGGEGRGPRPEGGGGNRGPRREGGGGGGFGGNRGPRREGGGGGSNREGGGNSGGPRGGMGGFGGPRQQ
ncbi:polyribonucleotide nucleotidyltransferase [Abditibacterium utsteinense]|uniref:Polyribonucleotide nucleotidyltransferase n=1 Tax=Abditibacterium utsteinense TaxID=1960156 RepID=A0A2S8SWU0_9BACT|nr:polyribonucleotide nucleotidyltransferase [Abditibacterium utsteinense]PQV65261.1 polyribonucleotide nucleotidyltransferase [Abditibacterium utsteinense]